MQSGALEKSHAEFLWIAGFPATMVMTTKHTSTDLELVDIRIREALKSLAISDVVITENLQDLSMENIRRFAETGKSPVPGNSRLHCAKPLVQVVSDLALESLISWLRMLMT